MNYEVLAIGVVVAAVVIGALLLYAVVAVLGLLIRAAAGPAKEPEPSLLERVDAIRPPRSALRRVDRGFDRLVHGTMFGITTEQAITFILLFAGIGGLTAFLVSGDELAAVGGALLGAALTLAVFYAFQNRWRRAVQDQLPDAVFQLSRSLRAGLNLPDSLRETAEYTPDPVAGLFRKAAGWVESGLPVRDAVRNLADEVRLTDFDTLAAVLAIQAEYGGSLPVVLDRLATAIRDRNQFRGYARSVTALSRATATFVALAAPAAGAFLAVFQPELFQNFFRPESQPLGWALLAGACVLEVVGVFWVVWLLSRNETL